MKEIQTIIDNYFQEKEKASQYIEARLLEDYTKAPPNIGYIDSVMAASYPTDILQIIFQRLLTKQKNIFLAICLELFKQWGKSNNSLTASAFGHLVFFLYQLSESNQLTTVNKNKFIAELSLTPNGYDHATNSIYAEKVSLIDLWSLWSKENWEELFEKIVQHTKALNKDDKSLILMATDHIDWNESKTEQFLIQAVKEQNFSEQFIQEYFFICLYRCGLAKKNNNQTTKNKIRDSQQYLIRNIVSILPMLQGIFTNNNKMTKKWLSLLQEFGHLFKNNKFLCKESTHDVTDMLKKIKEFLYCDEYCEKYERHPNELTDVA